MLASKRINFSNFGVTMRGMSRVGMACSMLAVLILATGCPTPPATTSCDTTADCDNTDACNPETCVAGVCDTTTVICDVAGETCVDGVCVATCTDDAGCDDNVFCNGSETCVNEVCVAGTAEACDDGDNCTDDSCDAATDACVNDAKVCPAAQECDAATGNCVAAACNVDGDCDDEDLCTTDSCDAALGTCVNADDTAAAGRCDDSDPCTDDSCDATDGSCVNTDKVCPAGETCDATGTCVASVACTDDAGCDDGLFCNGTETCDLTDPAAGVCVDGTAPCTAGQTCDDVTDACVDPTGDTFTLTTDIAGDAFTGTSGNDIFNASVGTLQTVDIIVGSGGSNDVLNATIAGTTSTKATIIDIDVVNFTTLNASTFDAVNAAAIGIWNIVAGSTGSLTMTNLEASPTFTLPSGFAKQLSAMLASATGASDTISVTLNGTAAGAGIATPNNAALETLNINVAADSSITAATPGTSFFGTAVLNNAKNVVITGAGTLTFAGANAVDIIADTYDFTGFTGNTAASMANNPGATNVSTLPRFVRYTINDTAGGQNHAVTLNAAHSNVTFDVNTIPALAALGTLGIIQGANANDSATVNLGGAGTGSGAITAATTEFLTINSGGTTANAVANVTTETGTAFVTESLTIMGSQNLTLGTVTTETLEAGAFTGTLSLTAAGSMLINGGTGVDTITGSGATDQINGNNGNDVIVAGGGTDTINGGADNDSIDGGALVDNVIGGTGADTLRISVAGAAGVDRALFTDFDDTTATGDVVNLNSGIATLTGTDNFATAATIQTHSGAGALTVLAATEVVVVTSATVADLTSANSLNGTNLLTAVGGTITGAIAGQNDILICVADASGNVGVYYATSANNAIINTEITLVAVLSGTDVTLANMVFGNFANAL